ncbi:MAG: thioredoxin family protein [Sutterellaceae bacterium]|nr:thioredoxin family protein [Sutterellaceae bacterium]MDY2868197.1 thioredoxin family protein [Mesosutterella sp.]
MNLLRNVFLLAAACFISAAGASGLFVTGGSVPASGPLPPASGANPGVKARLIAASSAAIPGSSLSAAVELDHEKGWHTYWKNPGDVGAATEFEWHLPKGWAATGPSWPEPQATEALSLTNYSISGKALYPFRLQVPANASGTADVRVRVSWVACREQCIPGEADVFLRIPVSAKSSDTESAPLIRAAESRAPVPAPGSVSARTDKEKLLITVPGRHRLVEFFPDTPGEVAKPLSAGQPEGSGDTSSLFTRTGANDGAPVTGLLLLDGGFGAGGESWQLSVRPESGPLPAAALSTASASGPSGAPSGGEPGLTFLTAALFAALGGLILNLMPCVFPVLSLKLLDLIRASREERLLPHGLAFTSGVLLSMAALSATLVALKAAGASIGWGFQLQNPVVILVLSILFLTITLNLAGLFEFTLGSRAGGALSMKAPSRGISGSFFTGVLAVIVASPCTAPFMGAALGFALSQPASVAVTIFLALGAGMALPWLLLTIFPGWARHLPRPGAWMETLKRVMAVPVGLSLLWLLWVLSKQLSSTGLASSLGILALTAASLWLFGRGQRREKWGGTYSASFPAAAAAALVVFVALGGFGREAGTGPAPEGWQAWSPEAVAEAKRSGHPVFIDFTAAWCMTCQVNKKAVLETEDFRREAGRLGYSLLVADWTNRDARISGELARYGRSGVPLYLVISPTGGVSILPALLTKGSAVEELRKGAGS